MLTTSIGVAADVNDNANSLHSVLLGLIVALTKKEQ